MTADPTAADALLDRIRRSGLLPADRLADLDRWAARAAPTAAQLAQTVTARGLLTRYQVRELAAGRAAGLVLGPYHLLDLLGEGGMGQVFRARHTRLDREVAVKLIRPERLTKPAVVDRFHHEIRAAARLHHPNVVLAFDADAAGGRHYYTMEFVPGSDLGKVVGERGPLPVAEACDYVRQAADGLQHAADLGLVHRDVKPANLLVTPAGRVKVLDLGLAVVAADPGGEEFAGKLVGTPEFMAPEQARDPMAVDTRADVYALGCTLFYLLTGQPPYGGDTPTEKVVRHLTSPVPSARDLRPEVPAELDEIVRWMLNKSPDDRPPTPAVVATALAGFAAGHVPAPPAPAGPGPAFRLTDDDTPAPTRRPAPVAVPVNRRSRALLAGAGLLALLLLAGVVAVVVRGRPAPVAGEPPAEFRNGVGMTLIRLPGGTFSKGSPDAELGRTPDEVAATVTVAGPLYVSTTEVSQAQFLAVMGKSPARWAGRLRDAKTAPVDSVTCPEAAEFCRRLTEREAATRPGWAYRLPTEDEWEYAARGGTAGPFWCGGKLKFPTAGVYDPAADDPKGLGEADPKAAAEKGFPRPVGSTRANPFGLCDVAGNVWEWATGPGEVRAVRGGSWREPAARCRSAARRVLAPDARADDIGFRVVLAPAGG
jgi:formylglycine-generating enzyme required for sulfatase activity